MKGEPAPPRPFWLASGFHLLARDQGGRLAITDDFLRAYFLRPEIMPEENADRAERMLHDALLADPRRSVEEAELASLADVDLRDNYRLVLRLRDRLLAADSLEAAYLALFRDMAGIELPPLFVDHLAHAILRNVLQGETDPFRLRAAELLFRTQRISLVDGAILAADEDVVELAADTEGNSVLDVMIEENSASYWQRSDLFDMAFDLSFGCPGLDALCRVLEAWTAHLLGVFVQISPVGMIRDEHWSWHIGLDAPASAILDDLYRGAAVDEARLAQILSLFRLEFRNPAVMRADLAGRPVYLGMAMSTDRRLRLKPQNLLANLPLAVS